MTAATPSTTRTYDIICFGDEVPGLLAIISAAREFSRRSRISKNPKTLKTLVMFKGNSPDGVGGHLVRGGLAYLDRTHVPDDIPKKLGLSIYGDPAFLYKEFLKRSGVIEIALDPGKADAALRKMLSEAGTDIISRIEIRSVIINDSKITGISLNNGTTFLAKQFIDCTVNAELAQAAGATKLKGFSTFGLPESELPVTLTFETQGLTIAQLQKVELAYLNRLNDPNDVQAQKFIQIAAGADPKLMAWFKKDLLAEKDKSKKMHVGSDHIDIRCKALSIVYHAFRGKPFLLAKSGAVFDAANIAVLSGGRLSWNALLCSVTGSQAELIARSSAKPTPAILEEMTYVDRFMKSLGATSVRPAKELYIRHAGNVTEVVEPLSGARMLEGGTFKDEAIGTFGYALDVRGGIEGLGLKASAKGFASISFHKSPLFNIGIRHALLRSVSNLAVVSPASGFDGYACAAGRIVEFNVAVGQGVGIAAALAITNNRDLATISNLEVRQVLKAIGKEPIIYGKSYVLEATNLRDFETRMA